MESGNLTTSQEDREPVALLVGQRWCLVDHAADVLGQLRGLEVTLEFAVVFVGSIASGGGQSPLD